MKQIILNVLVAFFVTLLCVSFSSCKKDKNTATPDPQPSQETTLIGNWRSYKWEEISEEYYAEATSAYTIVFDDDNAVIRIEDGGIKTINTDYRFKENDDSIIYFQRAYDEYGYMIVGNFLKTEGKLIIEVRRSNWDWYERYSYTKE